ncbi:MAG: 50S ribosomal protein L22 [Candidatus Doudnabacteria bacterium RIFCSPLOWO2_12_FULL_42_9]|nr:MAG: 50S ribosomal protein L22 [Candidatus Doudnabacteria bacterium RIFCSPLOWO2_12_FULL_42_9]
MAEKNPKLHTEVKAFARYIHVSPRKLRLVADLVRKMHVSDALEQLRFSSKNAALPLSKAINSAIANGVHNFNMNKDDMFIKSLTVDGGPVYKRYAPRAQGRAFVERKRTSHISVVLESRAGKSKKKYRSVFSLRPKAVALPEAGQASEKQNVPKQAPKSDEKMKQQKISLKRRLFNRRSGQ